MSRLLPARWWHNTARAQVQHHLSVVIEAMPRKYVADAQRRLRAFAKWVLDGCNCVVRVDRPYCLVGVGVGVLQEFDDVGLRLHAVRSTLPTSVNWGLLTQNGCSHNVIHSGYVLH